MKTIKIGQQEWTKKNLRVFKFRNGDIIPIVQDDKLWVTMETAAMCINPNNGECYYNWFAVNDERGLAPEGFHIPSDEEWEKLVNKYGGEYLAGENLKSSKKWDGNNSSGFSGLPAGYRDYDGYFNGLENFGSWWCSSLDRGCAIRRSFYSGDTVVNRNYSTPRNGFSIRLIKD